MPYFFCVKKSIISILFFITSIVSYTQTNVANSYLSGGNARVVEIKGINGATVFGNDLTDGCAASWEPQGTLCNSSNSNDRNSSVKTSNSSGATWQIPTVLSEFATGVLVIDFGESKLIDLLQVYQMFSDGKVTHIQFFSHASKTIRPTYINSNWVSMGPETAVFPGAISGNTVTQPTNITVTAVHTRYLKIHVKNTGVFGHPNYIELRSIKAFATAPTTSWKTQLYTGYDKTLADLQVTGTNIKWYNTAVGGSLLPTTTTLVNETTYYASQTVNGSESVARIAVKAHRISETIQTFLPGSTVNNLVSTPSTGGTFTYSKWYTSAVGGDRLSGTEVLNGGTYYIEQYSEESVINLSSIGFAYPYGVAVDASGDIFVADLGNDLVKKMNSNGTNVETFGNDYNAPTAITIDASGSIYIVDSGNDRIKKVDRFGDTIQIFDSGFNSPFGIAIDASGVIYVTDSEGVKKMNNDGTNLQTIGTGFNSLFGIAIDTSGTIYVTDNNEVKKMNNDGTNIQVIGSGFIQLAGIAVDLIGNVYVADVNNNVIKKMNTDGTNIDIIGTATGFNIPYGITVDSFGNAYIADTGNHRIRKVANMTTSNRVPVIIDILPFTAPPTTTWKTQVYTGDNKTLADLQVEGTNIIWYDAAIAGNILSINTSLVDETTYYATQTISGVESGLRAAITVNRISDSTQLFSLGSIINNLISTPSINTTSQWFTTLSSNTVLTGTNALNIGSYYVQQYSNGSITPPLGSGFILPAGVAVDASGAIYIADYGNFAIKKMNNDGTNVQTLGSGFAAPGGIAVDDFGFIYVADTANNAIKKMDANGTNIQTLGSGFDSPSDIAVNALGTIYVVDRDNYVVKKMNNDGTTIQSIGSGFVQPFAIALDSAGNVYVTDIGDDTIKKMNSDGTIIQTIASGFNSPTGITVTASGSIYVVDSENNVVKKMNNDGTNIQIIANGLNSPFGITLDTSGTIYISENNFIKKIIPEITSNRVPVAIVPVEAPTTTWETQVYTGDDKTLANLQITGNTIVWYDASTLGNVVPTTTALVDETTYYATQTVNSIQSSTRLAITVKRISDNIQTLPDGSTVSNLISTEKTGTTAQWFASVSSDTQLATTDVLNTGNYYVEQYNSEITTSIGSGFSLPFEVTLDASGTIYVADTGNGVIKKMNNDGTNINIIASDLPFPTGIALDATGNIYIANFGNSTIVKMNNDGTNIQVIGSGFNQPYGVTVDASGNIYVVDTYNNAVKKMNNDGTNIQTIATGLDLPTKVAVDASGNIYVTDSGNNTIKKMNNDGTNIQVIGSGFDIPAGITIDASGSIYVTDVVSYTVKKMNNDGTNIQTIGIGGEFNQPIGVTVDALGNVYVADAGNNSIKKIAIETTSNRVPVNVDLNTLSTNEFDISNQIAVYPNPIKNVVTIKINTLTNVFIEVIDILGRLITSQKLVNIINTIDMSNFQSGVYLLKIKANEGSITKKVIKK